MSAAANEWVKRVLQVDAGSWSRADAAVPQGAVPAGAVNYAKARLAWTAAKGAAESQLKGLQQSILQRYQGVPAFAEINAKIGKFDAVLSLFAENLADALDDAYSASDPQLRQEHHKRAAGMIASMLARTEGDAFIAKLERNPFTPFTGREVLLKTLGALSRQIA